MNEVFLLIFNDSRESPDTLVKVWSCDEQTAFVRSKLVNLGLMTYMSVHALTAFICFHIQEFVGGFYSCLYTFKSLFCSTPCYFMSLIVRLLSYQFPRVGFGWLSPHTFWILYIILSISSLYPSCYTSFFFFLQRLILWFMSHAG